jgi:hypothetical protein
MTDIYTPVVRALVAASLLLATATLMLVAVNTARAAGPPAISSCDQDGGKDGVIRTFFRDAKG